MKSNLFKYSDRRRVDPELTSLWKRYFDWALAAEPDDTPWRRELLLAQAAMFPPGRRNSKARLRECTACLRPYLGAKRAFRRDFGHYCPGCRRFARMTPSALHQKAIRPAQDNYRKMRRIRAALGEPPAPRPEHCQHGACTNERRLRQFWGMGSNTPLWLCPRHRWHAEQKAKLKLARPRPRGRPKK